MAKTTLWYTMCKFLQKGISFITMPLFLRLMTTDQYGVYTVYLSWLEVFYIVSSLYLFYGVTDNAMSKYENDRDRFIASMQGLCVSVTMAVAAIVWIFRDYFVPLIGLAPVMVALMFAEIFVTPALAFWSARQRFEYRYQILVFVTLLKSLLSPVLGLVAVYYADDKPLARIASAVAAELLVCGVIMVLQFVRGKVFFERTYWKYALVLALPMLPHYLSGIVLNHSDKIMISKMIGEGAVALYGVAYSIGMLVQIFVSAVNSSLTPWIYGKLKTGEIGAIQRRSRGFLVFVFCIPVGLMLVCPEVIRFFGSEKYAAAVPVVPPVAASVFFIFLYGFLSFPEFYYEKTGFLMAASILAAVLNLVLNFIFIPVFGFVAAAYTTLACYVVYSLGHYIVGARILKEHTGHGTMIDDRLTLLLSMLLIVSGALAHFLFPYVFLRAALLLCGLAAAVYKRGELRKMLF